MAPTLNEDGECPETPKKYVGEEPCSSWNENDKRTRSPTGDALLTAEAQKNNRKAEKRRRRRKREKGTGKRGHRKTEGGDESDPSKGESTTPEGDFVEFEEVYCIAEPKTSRETSQSSAREHSEYTEGQGEISRVVRGRHFAKGWLTNLAEGPKGQPLPRSNDRTPSPENTRRQRNRAAPNTDQPIRNRRERYKEYSREDPYGDENTNSANTGLKLPGLPSLKNSRHQHEGSQHYNHSHYPYSHGKSPLTPHSPEKRGGDDNILPMLTPRGTQTERRTTKTDTGLSFGLPALKTSR